MPRPRIENGVGEWTKHEVLGRGAHGVVYRGVVVDTHESIAVKQIRTNGLGKSELQVWCEEQELNVTCVTLDVAGLVLYGRPRRIVPRWHA